MKEIIAILTFLNSTFVEKSFLKIINKEKHETNIVFRFGLQSNFAKINGSGGLEVWKVRLLDKSLHQHDIPKSIFNLARKFAIWLASQLCLDSKSDFLYMMLHYLVYLEEVAKKFRGM